MIILTLYTTYQHVSVSNICQPRILTFCSFMIKIIDIAAIRLPAGTYPATQPATLLYFLPAACLLSESPGWSNIQYQILTVFSLPTVSPNILTKLVPYPRVISDIIQNWTMQATGVTHTRLKRVGINKEI